MLQPTSSEKRRLWKAKPWRLNRVLLAKVVLSRNFWPSIWIFTKTTIDLEPHNSDFFSIHSVESGFLETNSKAANQTTPAVYLSLRIYLYSSPKPIRDIQLNQKRLLWQLVIGNWAFEHMEQSTDLLEWSPNNSFLIRNCPMPKQPSLNQLYPFHNQYFCLKFSLSIYKYIFHTLGVGFQFKSTQ